MIQITLSFNTLDEAIVFLGKQHAASKIRKVADSYAEAPSQDKTDDLTKDAGVSSAAPAASAPNSKRKPRADAGKPRGSYKNAGAPVIPSGTLTSGVAAPVEAAADTPAAPAPEAKPEGAAPSAITDVAPSGEATTEKDTQEAIQKVFSGPNGPARALALLESFGVKRCRELKPEQYADFVAKCAA